MGRPRRKPPSPGRQWFVARRFPTLAASSFQPPLHGFPSSSGCRHARHVIPKAKPRTTKARMPRRQRGTGLRSRPSEFVVARCDAPEVLEPAVAALDARGRGVPRRFACSLGLQPRQKRKKMEPATPELNVPEPACDKSAIPESSRSSMRYCVLSFCPMGSKVGWP